MKAFLRTIVCGLCLSAALCSFFGCSYIYIPYSDNEEAISEGAMQIGTKLIQAIEDADSEAFRELMADYLLERSDFENGEEYTFGVYTGSLQSAEQSVGSTEELIGPGKKYTVLIDIWYDIVTDECEYEMLMCYCTKGETNQGKICALKILKKEDMPESGAFADMTGSGWIYYPENSRVLDWWDS